MRVGNLTRSLLLMTSCLLGASQALAQAANGPAVTPDMVQRGSDIPAHVQMPETGRDYIKQDVMIPMRDG